MTVSPDGNTLTFEFSDSSNSNGAPVTGNGGHAAYPPIRAAIGEMFGHTESLTRVVADTVTKPSSWSA